MSDESAWINRAQSAEARISTMKSAYESAIERVKVFKANFGIREQDNGEINIDFDKFVERLGKEQALALKRIIDEKFQ